jgi:AcrR family transcriptional regulator
VTRTTPGRPRAFDADEALDRAVEVFWSQGYEGASLDDLTAAMGITRTSLYRAFGNKEALFGRALRRYTGTAASYVVDALGRETAREVARAFLAGAVAATTREGLPTGCLGVQGALASGPHGAPARDALVAWREDGGAHLRERLERAVREGDLPADADAGLLARYLMAVANGIAVQAAGGASRDDLARLADLALAAWPAAVRPADG